MKCPECGSEYFSSAGRCFACSSKLRVAMRTDPGVKSRRIALAVGACLFVLGVALASVALLKVGDVNTDYQGVSFLGAFLASIGVGVTVYAFFSVRLSLWEIRNGKEQVPLRPLALMTVGMVLIVFDVSFTAILMATDVPTTTEAWIGLTIMCVAAVFVLAGAVTRYTAVRIPVELSEPSRRVRLAVGSLVILAGVTIEITVPFVVGPMDFAYPLMVMLLGVVCVVVGLALLTVLLPGPGSREDMLRADRASRKNRMDRKGCLPFRKDVLEVSLDRVH